MNYTGPLRLVCTKLFITTVVCLCWQSCSKKPTTIEELVPDLVFDKKAQAKQFAVVAQGTQPMIDDLEDGDLDGRKLEGRNWSWEQFDDATDGTQFLTIVQLDKAPGQGENVLYVRGGGWANTGAGLSAKLAHKASPRSYGVYDASAYTGIKLWVKVIGLKQLKVEFGTPETTSPDNGGICLDNCPANFTHAVPVSDSWIQVKIPFEAFVLTAGKHSLPLNPSNIKGIHFSFETLGDYEVWIDEFSFYH
jgi:hypothetical protein